MAMERNVTYLLIKQRYIGMHGFRILLFRRFPNVGMWGVYDMAKPDSYLKNPVIIAESMLAKLQWYHYDIQLDCFRQSFPPPWELAYRRSHMGCETLTGDDLTR